MIVLCFAGAIFREDQKDSTSELAFKYAVYKINKEKSILPKTKLVYDIQYVFKDDSFHASKRGILILKSTNWITFQAKLTCSLFTSQDGRAGDIWSIRFIFGNTHSFHL